MKRKSDTRRKAPLGVGAKEPGPNEIPAVLPKPLQPYAAPEGASVFQVALTEATPEHVRKTQEVTGLIDGEKCVVFYQKTNNLVWLWLSIALSPKPEDIPSEVFAYLFAAAKKVLEGFVTQVNSLERVHITPGKELEEAIVRRSQASPPPPDILGILGLSQPGRNLFQAAARDFRNVGFAAGVENLVREKGCSLDQAYADLAMVVGRGSAATGPSAASIKQFATKGRKLLGRPASKVREKQP